MLNRRKLPPVLFVIVFLGTWCATVTGQTEWITIKNTDLLDFSAAEKAAIQRAVDYWNDVISAPASHYPSGALNVTFSTNGAYSEGSGTGGFSYGVSSGEVISSGGTVQVSAGTLWATAPNTQIASGTYDSPNLEKLIVHELGHVLNIMTFGLDVDLTIVTIDKPAGSVADAWSAKPYWSKFIYDKDENKLMDYADGTSLTINTAGSFTFQGTNAMKVWGDGTAIPLPVYSVSGEPGSTLAHPETPFGTMNAKYNEDTRPFFSEVELAIMQDLGHDIDIKNFCGRSFYQTHAGTININDPIKPLNGMYGVGLHLVAANNTINLNTNITTTGYAGAGIRIENDGNNVTIANGVTVAATGEEGVGVLVTHQGVNGGTILTNRGTITATGMNGTGVWFHSDVDRFDNHGTINAGAGNNAIYIDSTGGYKDFIIDLGGGYWGEGRMAPKVDAINFYDGTHIIGNIVTDSDFATEFNVWGTAKFDGNMYIPNSTLQVKNGGTLAPRTETANTFATLDITGNLTMESGSTLSVEIGRNSSNAFDSDKIVVTGKATIQPNAQLKVEFIDGECDNGNEFELIRASSFANATLFTPVDTWATSFLHEIRSNSYWISWTATTPDFAKAVSGVASSNAYNAAVAIDSVRSGSLYKALAGMNKNDPQALANAFAQLHGEAFAASQMASAGMQQHFQQKLPSMKDRQWNNMNGTYLGQSSCERAGDCVAGRTSWTRWGSFTGDWLRQGSIDQSSGFDVRTAGVMVGADYRWTKNAFFGGAFGYDNAFQSFQSINSHHQMDVFRLALYGGVRDGNTYVDGYVSYAKNWHKTRRDINFANFEETVRSSYDDDLFSLGFELGRKFQYFTPSIGLHCIHVDTPSVTETGGSASLHISGNCYQSLRMPVGTKWSRDFFGGGIVWTPEVRTYYVREFADDSAIVRTSFDSIRNVSFMANSGKLGRNSGRFGVGLGAKLSERVNFRVDYDYEVYEHTAVGELGATLGVKW